MRGGRPGQGAGEIAVREGPIHLRKIAEKLRNTQQYASMFSCLALYSMSSLCPHNRLFQTLQDHFAGFGE